MRTQSNNILNLDTNSLTVDHDLVVFGNKSNINKEQTNESQN